jgi:hypothetical protein
MTMDKHILITNSEDWMNERKRQNITGLERDVYIKERIAAEFTMWVEKKALLSGFKYGVVAGLGVAVVVLAIVKLTM